MDHGMPMSPVEYERHYNDELDRDRKRNEEWQKMKKSCKRNIDMLERLSEVLEVEMKSRENDN